MDQQTVAISATPAPTVVETDIPARLDRLPWSRFHTLVVAALGITWILDGLEVTLAGSVAGALKASPVLQFSNADVGLTASAYLAGAVLGALFFGWLTDRLGRKKLFFITLGVYLVATAATALVVEFLELRAVPLPHRRGHRRRIRGDQLDHPGARSPRAVRGWTDLVINGSFWIGAALGALGSIVAARSGAVIDPESAGGSRFVIGAPAGADDLLHARLAAGKPALADDPRPRRGGRARSSPKSKSAWRGQRAHVPSRPACPRCACARDAHAAVARVAHTLFHRYRQRTLVGLALMAAQAFFYNAIFFTYALILTEFYGIACGPRRLVHPAVRGRQFPRAAVCSAGCSTASAAGR